jgi:molybdopterin/thiamine biosynthesis adenylyltransferase
MHPDLLRYSCQVTLPGFGEASQQLLQNAKVLIVGAGGLGCPSAQYLAASGIGTLGIADFDTVSISNLHRQVLYNPSDVGLVKSRDCLRAITKAKSGYKIGTAYCKNHFKQCDASY